MKIQKKTFTCTICGLVYEKKELADACREFCSKHNACSPEIARHSVMRR